jgi:hypothetical protein
VSLKAKPISQRDAFAYIEKNHRHHKPPQGAKICIAVERAGEIVGVVVIGRPVSRMLDTGDVAEVTRLCTDGSRNACSFLYSAARRVALGMGYTKVITYILASESGASLRASGWKYVRMAGGGSWSRPSRSRKDKAPLEEKQLWEAT